MVINVQLLFQIVQVLLFGASIYFRHLAPRLSIWFEEKNEYKFISFRGFSMYIGSIIILVLLH